MTNIVTPGTVIGAVNNNELGIGTTELNGNIVATITGKIVEKDGLISVKTHNEMLHVGVGDIVICAVVKLNEKSGEAMILSVEGKENRSIMADDLYAQFHVTKITDRFLHNTADGLRRRDIIRAKVIEAGNVIRIDMREDEKCGVLWALCPPCGDTFQAELNGDWNVICRTCGNKSFRALADDFGGESGKAALNGAGKRWGKDAENLFSKGSAGRATFIAEDIREDGRVREYFRFEGSDGGGRRSPRQNHKPGCRLFLGGLSRDADETEVKNLFSEQGKITDFALMRDDQGNLKGFGFITFEEKEMADNAIAKLNGQRINGRRIGVRDADAPREERQKKKRHDGARLYVGNLPFKAEDKDVAKLFEGKCDSAIVEWATDRSGRRKAFAFVTVKPENKGEEIASSLNGIELMERKLKIEVSKPSTGNNRGKDKQSGGKTTRELRALQEEEEDAKKKRRRPRKD
ncbi:MAG: exosome complex RNA-binding protein Csl4 [Candidatus Poseidoniaceae archaeon]|nr:exosome complex RNA-binding protein Csl4 [Candidatus Poseidoniaceae archaeon]